MIEEYPGTLIISTESDGYIGTYEIPSLDDSIDTGENKTFVVANYYDGIEDFNFHKLPHIYKTEESYQKNPTEPLPQGYPYFTWSCLDSAHEVKHRIHLIIREWNTVEEFNKFVDSNGTRGDPDIDGLEGEGCDYYSLPEDLTQEQRSKFMYDCDDMMDFFEKTGYYPEVHYK